MEHCTYIVHQDKMAVLAEVSKSTVTFEPDVFRKNTFLQLPKIPYLTQLVSLVLLVICVYCQNSVRTNTHTHTHTHTQDNYCNPRCTYVSRVMTMITVD